MSLADAIKPTTRQQRQENFRECRVDTTITPATAYLVHAPHMDAPAIRNTLFRLMPFRNTRARALPNLQLLL